MSSSYKVLAPYVTAKVKDVSGQSVVLGYYRDGLIQDPVDAEHIKALVDLGMVEESSQPVEDAPTDPADDAPKGNASREEWAAYAATQGASTEETRPVEEGGLKQTELRDKYGK